jgi:programmed cell death 6-interacting protein
LAEYFESLKCKEAKDFGEELARLKVLFHTHFCFACLDVRFLQHAKTLMGAAEQRGGQYFIFGDMHKKIARSLEAAENDNNFIYHAKIPELGSIPSIGKAAVAKSLPFSPPLSSNFKGLIPVWFASIFVLINFCADLFEKLVPLSIHNALTSFENQKAAVANQEIARLREGTQFLNRYLNCHSFFEHILRCIMVNSVLASLNLPAAIEDLSGQKVPASVLEKAAKIRDMGGVTFIMKQMTELPELLQRNKEILDDVSYF